MSGRRALFRDLGGTLVRVQNDEIYKDANGQIEFLPRRREILLIKAREFEAVFIVTNQAGIEDGTISVADTASFIFQLNEALGGLISDYWACPRRNSPFRKPNPWMLTGLADKHYLDLSKSIFVGDSETDRVAAQAAGVEFAFSLQRLTSDPRLSPKPAAV